MAGTLPVIRGRYHAPTPIDPLLYRPRAHQPPPEQSRQRQRASPAGQAARQPEKEGSPQEPQDKQPPDERRRKEGSTQAWENQPVPYRITLVISSQVATHAPRRIFMSASCNFCFCANQFVFFFMPVATL